MLHEWRVHGHSCTVGKNNRSIRGFRSVDQHDDLPQCFSIENYQSMESFQHKRCSGNSLKISTGVLEVLLYICTIKKGTAIEIYEVELNASSILEI
jgi:hypothetical protein